MKRKSIRLYNVYCEFNTGIRVESGTGEGALNFTVTIVFYSRIFTKYPIELIIVIFISKDVLTNNNNNNMVKHVFRYLKGTSHYKLVFRKTRMVFIWMVLVIPIGVVHMTDVVYVRLLF